MRVRVVVWREEDVYVAREVATGVTSQGKTLEEAVKNIQEALELYLEEAPEALEKPRWDAADLLGICVDCLKPHDELTHLRFSRRHLLPWGAIVESAMSAVEKLVLRRRWLIEEIKRFERKYGIDSRDFYEKWRKGLLPEPLDPETHGDFMVWYGLVEELNRVEKELEKRLKHT